MQKNHHLLTQILKKKHLISLNNSNSNNNQKNNLNNNQNRSITSIIGSGINSPSNVS